MNKKYDEKIIQKKGTGNWSRTPYARLSGRQACPLFVIFFLFLFSGVGACLPAGREAAMLYWVGNNGMINYPGSNGKFANANAKIFNDRYRSTKRVGGISLYNTFQESGDSFSIGGVDSEQNNARLPLLRESENGAKIEVHRNNNSAFKNSVLNDFPIGCLGKFYLKSMNGIITQLVQKLTHLRRNRHCALFARVLFGKNLTFFSENVDINQKFHAGTGLNGRQWIRFFAGKPGSIRYGFLNIGFFQIGIILKNILVRFAGGQKIENQVNWEPQIANASLSAQDLGINGNSLELFHSKGSIT